MSFSARTHTRCDLTIRQVMATPAGPVSVAPGDCF